MRTRTKTISLTLLGVIASGGTSHNELRAQDAPKGDAPQQGQQRRRGPLMRILTELNLTDAQKAQIEPLVKDAQAQSRTVRQDNNLSREEKRAKQKEINDALRAKIEPLLDDAQKLKLAEIFKPQGRRQQGKA
jgi:Spy/CpxP family protein refolding chaperone